MSPKLWGFNYIGQSTLILFFCLGSHAILGAVDDWQGIKGIRGSRRRHERPHEKQLPGDLRHHFGADSLLWPAPLGLCRCAWLSRIFSDRHLDYSHHRLIIVGMSNAVNLTDGLDSLAGSLASLAFACYGLIAYLQKQDPLMIFCFTIVGSLLAFLWYNAHPAQMFMGDTGSLALGATLGYVAVLTGQWLLLPVVGFVFVAEAVSVIMQVSYFKWTKRVYGEGRRIFKMSPLHYHFELLGWSEMQVKERFWLVGVLCGMLGVALALICIFVGHASVAYHSAFDSAEWAA